jgi:hypothetical protein
MRSVPLAVAAVALLFLVGIPIPSGLHAPGIPPLSTEAAPASASLRVPGTGAAPVGRIPAIWALNTTLSPGLLAREASSPPPISAITPVPLPPIPPTRPTVMTFLTNSTSCCVSANYTAPTGAWSLILLNYTGQAVAGVYDSSFRAYVDQAQVFFGTTPEYGIWYDEADLTPYASLLTGAFNFTFLLGAAVTSGYFLTSVSLLFYPVVAGQAAPTEPNLVIPLWHRVFVSSTGTFVWDVATIPQNVTNATLQLWAYGFGPDEFWYAQQPALRTIQISVDNSTVLDYFPFQYINTGGNDLFAWRPVTGVFTLSDRPYDLDVTALLSSIEGTHNLTATITGVAAGSSWLLGGSLLLYTNATAPAAASPSTSFSAGVPHVVSGAHSYEEFVNDSAVAQSTFGLGPTARTVAEFENSSYENVFATSTDWQNISSIERIAETVITESNGTRQTSNTSWTFPFSADLGSVFVPNSGQGSGYPIYGNVTDSMLDLQQRWNETSETWPGTGGGPGPSTLASVDYRVTGGNNLFVGAEELISANAAELLAITFVQSATTADYRASTTAGGLTWNYEHLQVGSGYDPPPPNEVETVLVNQADDPVSASLSVSRTEVDVGRTVTFDVRAVGGSGTYQYDYGGLPSGCSTLDAASVNCRPTATGPFEVWVVATDSGGTPSFASSVGLVVVSAPTATIGGNGTRVDAGATVLLVAQVSGGVAPYVCTWNVPGSPIVASSCQGGYPASGEQSGTVVTGTLQLVDATGATVNATFSFSVVPPPTVAWVGTVPSTATAPTALVFRAAASGGVAPYEYLWLVNDSVVQNSSDANFTLVVPGGATYSLLVEVTDADGAQAVNGPVQIAATGPPAPTPGTGASSSPAPDDVVEWALVAAVAAGAAGVLVGGRIGRASATRRPPR